MIKLDNSQKIFISNLPERCTMSLFSDNPDVKFCESCREKLFTPAEMWRIETKLPGSGGLGFFPKGHTYVLCKKCFMKNAELLEKSIIKSPGLVK